MTCIGIAIGIGSFQRGVGSTTLTVQLAALLQRAGHRVTVVETSDVGFLRRWCRARAARKQLPADAAPEAIKYLHLRDLPGRLRDHLLDADFYLLDYDERCKSLAEAMDHVQHWICPFGPLDSHATLATLAFWEAESDRHWPQQHFSAVLMKAPGPLQIEADVRYQDPRWNGTRTAETLVVKRSGMHVVRQRLTQSEAVADTKRGRDVFQSSAADAREARQELEAAWKELAWALPGYVAMPAFLRKQIDGASGGAVRTLTRTGTTPGCEAPSSSGLDDPRRPTRAR